MRISVIGTGYVGLVVGTCLAETGNSVICVDIDERKLRLLRKGISPTYEPGIEALLKNNLDAKRISFTTDIRKAITNSEVIFLALPTPSDHDGAADLKHVLQTAKQIGTHLDRKSTRLNSSHL